MLETPKVFDIFVCVFNPNKEYDEIVKIYPAILQFDVSCLGRSRPVAFDSKKQFGIRRNRISLPPNRATEASESGSVSVLQFLDYWISWDYANTDRLEDAIWYAIQERFRLTKCSYQRELYNFVVDHQALGCELKRKV